MSLNWPQIGLFYGARISVTTHGGFIRLKGLSVPDLVSSCNTTAVLAISFLSYGRANLHMSAHSSRL